MWKTTWSYRRVRAGAKHTTLLVSLCAGLASAQQIVDQAGDDAANPAPGTLRYAVLNAPKGSTITFSPALNGQTIQLDGKSPNNHIRISRDLVIQGPGADLLTISGDRRTRIFFIDGGAVQIVGLTLANGLAKGGDGGAGAGSAGGGGGAAGMGGAIFMTRASVSIRGVVFRQNRAVGGDGGAGGSSHATGQGGGGGGFAGSGGPGPRGAGSGGDLAAGGVEDGIGGAGGGSDLAIASARDGHWGAGGGGAGFHSDGNGDSAGYASGSTFGGGGGGIAGFYDSEGLSVPGSAGSGGCGFGGAIFVSSGLLQLIDAQFLDNASVSGKGGFGSAPGLAKGGAVFICSGSYCGPAHEAGVIWAGKSTAQRNSAADSGTDPLCIGRDDSDVCGQLTDPDPSHFVVITPESARLGEAFRFTVAALDRANTLVFTWRGSVRVESSDSKALPQEPAALSGGVGTLTMALNTPGNQTITVHDAGKSSVAGTSNPILVESGKTVRQ